MCCFYITVLSVKLLQSVRTLIVYGGEGCLLPEDACTKTGKPVADVLRKKHLDTRVPLVVGPCCSDFKEYNEAPEMVPLNLS